MVILKISIEYRAKFKKIIQYVVVDGYYIWIIWYDYFYLLVMLFCIVTEIGAIKTANKRPLRFVGKVRCIVSYLHDFSNIYLVDIGFQTQQMFDSLVEQLKEAEGVTDQLKEEDQLEWVQRIGNIQYRAIEIVCSELIYV